MGKGDIKSKKGKRKAGSSGVSRQKTKVVVEIKPKAKKKAPAKKVEAEKKPAAKKAAAKKPAAKKAAPKKKED